MLDPFTGEPTAAKVPVGQIAVGACWWATRRLWIYRCVTPGQLMLQWTTMEQNKATIKTTRAHPLTDRRAVRGMSQEVLERLMAGPPNQMTSGETEMCPPMSEKPRPS